MKFKINRSSNGVLGIRHLLLVVLVVFGGYKILSGFDTHNWPEARGKVTSVEIWENDYVYLRYRYRVTRNHQYIPVVNYVYLIDGVSYEGKSNLEGFESRKEACGYAASWYRKGTPLQVLYSPANPKVSSLTRTKI